MSEIPEEKPKLTKEELETAFQRSGEIDDQLSELQSEKNDLLLNIRQKILKGEIPKDAEFIAAALMSGSANRRRTYLEEIKEQLMANRGGVVAWISSEEEMTLHRFAGPNEYRTRWFLNLGEIPEDASLIVKPHGQVEIPVGKMVSTEIMGYMRNRDEKGEGPAWKEGFLSGEISEGNMNSFELPYTVAASEDYPVLFGEEQISSLEFEKQPTKHERLGTMLAMFGPQQVT